MSVGLKTKKICDAITLRNRCSPCNKLERVKNKKEKAINANKKSKISKYSLRETKLAKHLCVKTWDKSSKSMESEAIVRFVLNASSKSGCYVRKMVIDDDTTTPARLKEDKGKKRARAASQNISPAFSA